MAGSDQKKKPIVSLQKCAYIYRESHSYSTFISNSIPLRLWVIIDSAIAIGYLSSGLDCKEQLVMKKERDSLLAKLGYKEGYKKKSGKDWMLHFIFMKNIIQKTIFFIILFITRELHKIYICIQKNKLCYYSIWTYIVLLHIIFTIIK